MKKIVMLFLIIISVIIVSISSSYALFKIRKTNDFRIVLGTLTLTISDNKDKDKILINNLIPTKDNIALNSDGYNFTVSNTGTLKSKYRIYLDDYIEQDKSKERINNDYIKVSITNNETKMNYTYTLKDLDSRILTTSTILPNTSISYTVRVWLDYNTPNSEKNKYTGFKIRVVGNQDNYVYE